MSYWFEQKISHFVENQKANQTKKNTRRFDDIRESYRENTERLIYSATPVIPTVLVTVFYKKFSKPTIIIFKKESKVGTFR